MSIIAEPTIFKKKLETIMSDKHIYYITEPLKGLISTVIADIGHQNLFFSLNLQEKKWFYVRDKIINHNLEIILCIKSPHVGWFCSMVGFITHKYKTGVFNFNKTHV